MTGVHIQSSSVTIVGFLAETRISDVIVQPEVRIVAGKKLAQKVYCTQLPFIVGTVTWLYVSGKLSLY